MEQIKIMKVDVECVICFEKVAPEHIIYFECSHFICLSCYETLLSSPKNTLCPICRMIVDISAHTETGEREREREQLIPERNQLTCIRSALYSFCLISIITLGLIFSSLKKN